LERLNREIGRRTDVAGIFPDDASLLRLTAMLTIEQNDCVSGWAMSSAWATRLSRVPVV
jgi:putative transposase